MLQVTLGRTGLTVNKNGFGALPVQRVPMAAAVALLRAACNGGINFFDTARAYTDSEEKIGAALAGVRGDIVLATKIPAAVETPTAFHETLAASLAALQTDHVDILQFHNFPFVPLPGDGSGLYEAMQQAQQQGKTRFIGFTNHDAALARQAVESGLYDTLQFPFSYLSGEEELALVALCRQHNVGFIAMKALSGGLITNAAAAWAALAQHDNVLPIWGVHTMEQLQQFLSFQTAPPVLDDALQAVIQADREQLAGAFCRGCGYCMPCPVGIPISMAARMTLMLGRAPVEQFTTPQWKADMLKIEDCLHCGQCAAQCPYHLDTPALLQKNLEDYRAYL